MSPRPRPESPASADIADFDLTPELEVTLNALARAGRDDPAARNELFARLSGKIARFLAPWRGRPSALGDFADLQQEAFIVFAGLVADWPGEGSFARYFFGFFPWRLRHAIARHERRWPLQRLLIVPHEDLDALAHAAEPDNEIQLLLGALSPNERRLLALRLGGYSLNAAAARLGWSPRTTARRWHALRRRLARGMA
jgi:RNA polymerase sigma factor (sigma-70 family)